ncbi:Uncharacterised protein [Klebsiella pneumoniae]|nr:Uncharacterised protein [Klebsiella pneumoniae]
MGEEELHFVQQAIFEAICRINEACSFDFAFLTIGIHEHADSFLWSAGARLIEQDSDMVELHIASDP